uniref:Uncharacterized protein n=1 Tax=Arundo donax TaxID=35708 RepID=A0A0A8ZC39_ARUDO
MFFIVKMRRVLVLYASPVHPFAAPSLCAKKNNGRTLTKAKRRRSKYTNRTANQALPHYCRVQQD